MKRVLPIVLLIALSAGVFAWLRQPELQRLRDENETLWHQVSEAEQLAREIEDVELPEVDPAELEPLQPLRNEVLKLRADVTRLREAARINPEEAREVLIGLLDQAEQENARAAFLRAMREADQANKPFGQAMSRLIRACKETARLTEGRMPRSFAELQAALDWLAEFGPAEIRGMYRHEADRLLHEESSFGPVTDHFEFVPHAMPPMPYARPHVLVLRERQPRPWPDGTWVRYYGLSDGMVEQVILQENRFDDWERDFLTKR
jgi:hypothetical protein